MAKTATMICPSCAHLVDEGLQYCTHCRMGYTNFNLFFSKLREHLYWILRRASAGFTAGLVAWFFIPIVSRILGGGSSPTFIFALTGLMGGAFLGCVDGMVEESSPKTIRGALMGAVGGLLGGILFVQLKVALPGDKILWAFFIYWAVAGAFVGMVSALWEKRPQKILIGILAGFLGGGIGGYLGAAVHSNLVQSFESGIWAVDRFFEALLGGIIGLSLWFFIAMAERFVIFRRRLIKDREFKQCDKCESKSSLSSWYCGRCGSVLQESAPVDKLNFPPHRTLNRLHEMFRFLSRLSAVTGFIAGFVSLFIFLPGHPFIILVVLMMVAIFSYGFQVLFSSLSESLKIFIGN